MSTPPDDTQRNAPLVMGTATVDRMDGGTVYGTYVNGDVFSTYNNYSSERPLSVSAPYKFLLPYTSDGDKWIFKGREEETRTVCQTLAEKAATVVWGRSGIGKTSLICAGVLPRLSSTRVVRLTSYEHPLEFLRKAFLNPVRQGQPSNAGLHPDDPSDTQLESNDPASHYGLDLPAGENLRQMIARVAAHLQMRLVIILDQFELFFTDATDPETRSTFIRELTVALTTKSPDFRLLIVVDTDAIGQVVELQSTTWPPGLETA